MAKSRRTLAPAAPPVVVEDAPAPQPEAAPVAPAIVAYRPGPAAPPPNVALIGPRGLLIDVSPGEVAAYLARGCRRA